MAAFSQGAQYDLGRMADTCAATGAPLEPGAHVFAALVDIPPEQREKGDSLGLARVDVSAAAWEDDGFRPDNLFSFWRTHVPEEKQKRRRFVDDAVLMELLGRLGDVAADDGRLAFRHVLALLLLRKKLLRLDGRATEEGDDAGGRPVWLLTPKLDVSKGWNGKWDESRQLRVIDPGLDEARLTAVTEQLRQIMDEGLEEDDAPEGRS